MQYPVRLRLLEHAGLVPAPLRYALVFANGPAVMFEFKGCMKQSEELPGIDELRSARTWMFMALGDNSDTAMAAWADEIADLVRIHDGGNRRIACDRLDGAGKHALEARGPTYVEGIRIRDVPVSAPHRPAPLPTPRSPGP